MTDKKKTIKDLVGKEAFALGKFAFETYVRERHGDVREEDLQRLSPEDMLSWVAVGEAFREKFAAKK